MTSFLTITDTGKRTTTSGSVEETDIVNSGTAIQLNGVEMTLEENAIVNNSSVVGVLVNGDSAKAYTHGEVDSLGVAQPKWTIRGKLRINNTADMAMVKLFRDLCRTKGYKTIGGDLPDWINGIADSSTVNVRFSTFSITVHSADNIVDFQLTAYETT